MTTWKEAILRAIERVKGDDGTITAEQLRPELPQIVAEVGSKAKAPFSFMTSQLGNLCREGVLERIGKGRYRVPPKAELPWHVLVSRMERYVVRIETPRSSGTGFLFRYYGPHRLPGIATAYHVVEHADLWQDPVRIMHNDKSELFKADERLIMSMRDSSIIWLSKPLETLELPEVVPELLPADFRIKVGVEVGWLGFAWGGNNPLRFFSGRISCFDSEERSYDIDGTAINGISGGPVIYPDADSGSGFYIIGSMSAYMPNRATGEPLPGLSVAQAASTLHAMVPEEEKEGEEDDEA